MDKYVMIEKDGKITIQEADYIEDGWYIEIVENEITLYEIPLYGGEEQKIGEYTTILDAIIDGEALT
jgi:hypothetical protein